MNNLVKAFRSSAHSRALLLVALAALAVPGFAAQDKQDKRQLSDKTSEALGKLTPLLQAPQQDMNAILAIIDAALVNAPPTSWDRAFLLDRKATAHAQMDQYSKAIAPWEEALKISDQFGYFTSDETKNILFYLAQLIFVEAQSLKDKSEQMAQVRKAGEYLRRHLELNKKPPPETQTLYASILFSQATADPNNVNQEQLAQARHVVEEGLLGAIKPKDNFYQLLLAILQQQGDNEKSAQILEFLLKQNPNNRNYWGVLAGMYLQEAQASKNEKIVRTNYIRAINTVERAQSLGFMKTPADNFRLVSVYLLVGQFSKGTELLHAGLKSGQIESTIANWRLLGQFYQQANKDGEAILALEEAAKLFPKEGNLDIQIGELYRGREDTRQARAHYRRALEKGNLERPMGAYLLLAYSSMELEDWDEALRAITEASKFPEFAKERQNISLKEHIERTVRERDEVRREAEEARQKAAGNAPATPKQ